jgi:sodium/glucose cotransporter 9
MVSGETANLDGWDIATIVLYFAIVMAVGIFVTVRANRNSAKGFFLAGKSLTFLPIAGSIFATNMGAPTLVGLAGSAADTGFAPIMFEWHATYMLVILGWLFVPIYVASGTFTMPEYLKKRFGGKRLRVYYAIVQLVLIILSGVSAEVYAGALFIQQILGWNLYLSVVLILAITAIYTIGGGLAAVIYTDALQTVILVIGCAALTGITMERVGGYEGMVNQYKLAAANTTYLDQSLYGNLSCGFTPDDSFQIFRGIDSEYPWPGLVFGLTLLATYFFCTNQVIVQRNLAAKNVSHSKAACVVASYLKILPFFLFVWPGMISRILYPDEIGCTDPDLCYEICENEKGCSNIAYPLLVLREMPSGLRGLMLAALLAALMSSLTSMFNSTSAIFTLDIWKLIKPKTTERETVIVGRVFSLVMIIISLLWLPILQAVQGSRLWDYIQAVSAYITPPWVIVFILGMFWQRCTERGAWWGLMVGLLIGLTRMILAVSYSGQDSQCGVPGEDTRPDILSQVHYLHFAIILGVCTLIVVVAVSIMTPPRPKNKLRKVTWWTRRDELEPELTESESEEEEEAIDDMESKEPIIEGNKWVNKICCFSGAPPEKETKEEKAEYRKTLTTIEEDPYWSRVCDINAVIAISVTCFIIGFYG